MSRDNLQTLTEEEQRAAEKYHNWIYYFLHKKGYLIDSYYDIAVMGFLKGIQNYYRKEGLQKWSMATICDRCMNREIGNYLKAQNRQKRKPTGGFVSLDETFADGNETYINTILSPTLEDEYFEEYDREHADDRIKDILSPLSDIQRKIIILKASGKSNSYIVKKLHISIGTLNRELKKIRGEIPNEEPTNTEPRQNQKTVGNITEYIGVPSEVLLTLKLSARQLDVINLLMVGYTEADVGRELNISRQAVYDALKKTRAKAARVGGY